MHYPPQSEGQSRGADWLKHLVAALLIGVAWLIASLGRVVLDWGVKEWPAHSAAIERVGGWFVGLVIVVVVLPPMFRMYGVFRGRGKQDRK